MENLIVGQRVKDIFNKKLLTATVYKMSWERVWLHIWIKIDFSTEADKKSPLNFYFVDQYFKAGGRAKIIEQSEELFHLAINVTNNGTNRVFPQGRFSIIIVQNDFQLAKAVASINLVQKLGDLSRNFLYNKQNNVYTFTFYIDEGNDTLPLVMYVLDSKRIRTKGSFNQYLQKKEGRWNPINKLHKWYSKNRNKIKTNIYNKLYNCYEHSGHTILFLHEQGIHIGSNMKPLKKRMEARSLNKQFTILENYRSVVDHPKQGIKSWLILLNKLAKADIVILEDHAPVLDWLTLNKRTKVIQLWHAGAGFKSSGYIRWGHLGCPAPWSAHRQYDYGIAGSKKIAKFFAEVWGINESRVLPTGMPRIDEFLDAEYRQSKMDELRQAYPMIKGKNVILFAPTYRGKNKAEAYYPYELIDFDSLYKACGDEAVVIFKMHPWVSEPVPIPPAYRDKFIDLNDYPDINDLFYVTSLLITDYSSNIFEYSLMHRPMLFFAFDEVQYAFSRGFHRNYRQSAPGKVCCTFNELLDAIINRDFEQEKVEIYLKNQFDYIDSYACDRVIDWLILGNIPENIQKEIDREDALKEELEKMDFTPLEEISKDTDLSKRR